MNERYLCRGKRLDNGEWGYGYYRVDRTKKHLIQAYDYSKHHNARDFIFECFEVDPSTVGLCTGLSAAKSYRGTEPEALLLFEGDAINAKGDTYTVLWNFDHARFQMEKDEQSFVFHIGIACDAEIIGNVHDAPTEATHV